VFWAGAATCAALSLILHAVVPLNRNEPLVDLLWYGITGVVATVLGIAAAAAYLIAGRPE